VSFSAGLRLWTGFIVLVVYGGFVAMNWLTLRNAEQTQEGEAHDTAKAYAQLVATAHDLWLRDFGTVLAAIAAGIPATGSKDGDCREVFSRFLSDSSGFDIVLQLGPGGTVICGPEGKGEGKNFADRLYYERAMATGKIGVGDVIQGRVSGKTVLPVAKPSIGPDGTVAFLLVAGRELDWVAGIVDAHRLPMRSEVLLFDPAGKVIAHSENGLNIGMDWPALHRRIVDGSGGGTGSLEVPIHTGDDDAIIAYTAMAPAEAELMAVVAVPKSVLMGEFQNLRNLVVLQAVGAGAALMIVLYLAIGHLFNRPLLALMRSMERVSRGDLEIEAGQYGIASEIKRMWRAFHAMVAALKNSHAELEHLSSTDGLTGVANRRNFDARMERIWKRAARNGYAVSLAMVDIDRFKAFNDGLGHRSGDECLTAVARCLKGALHRPDDFVARYGGEEFVIVLDNKTVEDAREMCEQLRMAVEALDIRHPEGGAITISIGVATAIPGEGVGPSGLIEIADANLYAAKRDGRNRVR